MIDLKNQPMWAVLLITGEDIPEDEAQIYVQAAPDTWFTVGEKTYITSLEFGWIVEDHPDWEFELFNGREA